MTQAEHLGGARPPCRRSRPHPRAGRPATSAAATPKTTLSSRDSSCDAPSSAAGRMSRSWMSGHPGTSFRDCSSAPPQSGCAGPDRIAQDQPSQASTLSWLSSTHLRRRPRRHAVVGDVLGDQVLVLVGPLEVLHQVDARAALLDPLGGDDLLQHRLRVVTVDLGRVVLAASSYGGSATFPAGSRRRATAARRSSRSATPCSPRPAGRP